MRMRISWDGGQVIARLADTPIARRMAHTMPVRSKVNRWGDEVYFKFPVQAELDPNATDVVEPGTVCYWVEGRSIAIPYGPTPASKGDECRLAAPVNILGKLEDDGQLLAALEEGQTLKIQLLGRTPWD